MRIETIPQEGRERDSRTALTSLSAQSVSPAKTGLGNLMSPQPRFATAFSEVSATESPSTTASVSVETTSGSLNSVRAAYSRLKCIWFVFIVRQVNHVLSASLIVRPSLLR